MIFGKRAHDNIQEQTENEDFLLVLMMMTKVKMQVQVIFKLNIVKMKRILNHSFKK